MKQTSIVQRIISGFFNVLKGLLSNTAYYLSGFFPRDKNIWVFGAWEGVRYCDNARYFFEFAIRNNQNPPKKLFWVTHNPQVAALLKSKACPVLLSNSRKAWWHTLRAGIIFVTHGRHDVIPFLTRGAIIVNLNHALPIKHMGYDIKNNPYLYPKSALRKWFFKIITPYWNIKFDYSLSASEKTSWITQSSGKMPQDRILSFGFPRFTPLLAPPNANDRTRLAETFACAPEKHWILYMPTFRDSPEFSHFNYGFDLQRLEKTIEDSYAVLLLALHPFDPSVVPQKVKEGKSPSIRCIYPMDVNELLPHIDILVTDYSSVMFDYLLLDRPIIYTRFDFEDFTTKQRGLYFNYSDVAAGEKAKDWDEVQEAVSDILLRRKDTHGPEREKVRRMVLDDGYRQTNEKIMQYFSTLIHP